MNIKTSEIHEFTNLQIQNLRENIIIATMANYIISGKCRRRHLADQLVTAIFSANLSFSALLLAVMGILVSLYIRAEHVQWKRKFRILLTLCGITFFVGIVDCILSLLYILIGFSSASDLMINIIVSLFVGELAILSFIGLMLVTVLVIK